MANEDLSFTIGLNTETFQRGLRTVEEAARETGHKIVDSLKDAGAAFLAPFASALAFEGVKKILEFGESIKRGAEIAGVSTEFFQNFAGAMRQTGGDAEKGTRAIERLSAMIGSGAEVFEKLGIAIKNAKGETLGTEEVMRSIADKIQGAKTATEASSIAVEIWGQKLGLDLIPALREGSKGLDDFGEKTEKLNEIDLEKLEQASLKLKNVGNWAEVAAAKLLLFAAAQLKAVKSVNDRLLDTSPAGLRGDKPGDSEDLRDTYRNEEAEENHSEMEAQRAMDEHNAQIKAAREVVNAPGGALRKAQESDKSISQEERLALLLEDRRRIEDDLVVKKMTQKEVEKELVEQQENKNSIAALELDMAKKITDERDKQLAYDIEIRKAKQGQFDAGQNLKAAADKGTKLTLEELYNSKLRFSGTLGEDQQKAYKIKELERQQEWNREHGFYDAAQDRQLQAQKLRDSLSANLPESDRHPFSALIEAYDKTTQEIKDLNAKASGKDGGIKIDPSAAP